MRVVGGYRVSWTGIEVVLQDNRGRGRVEALLPYAPILLAQRKAGFRLTAAEPLILQHHRQMGPLLEPGGKGLDPGRHVVPPAIETTRQADDDGGDPVLFSPEPGDIVRGYANRGLVQAGDPEDADRTGQRARRVADGHTDAPFSHVEADDPCHAV